MTPDRERELLRRISELEDEVERLKLQAQTNWEALEDVACGTKLQCLVCGGNLPCNCDKL